MKRLCILFAIALFPLVVSAEPLKLSAAWDDKDVTINSGDDTILIYRCRDDEKYPYFYPVNGPASGQSVTTQSSEPYPHHHSLFFGCDRVNGGNYWQEGLDRGRIDSETVELVEAEGERIVITQTSRWIRPGAPSPFADIRRIEITAPSPSLRLIDFTVTLVPLIDIEILNTNHSLFSARMVPELNVNAGGTLINEHGDRGEEATFQKSSRWMAYYGEREGAIEGLAIFDHPDNPWHPSPWFTRNYGFISPTNMNWMDGPLHLESNQTVTLRYLTAVYSGEPTQTMLESIYTDWAH